MDVKVISKFIHKKVREHIPSGFFCKSSRNLTMNIINFKTQKTKLITKKQQESYKNAKICYI